MMMTTRASRCGWALGAFALAAAPALAGPTPQEIFRRAEAATNGAKTYQATYRMTSSMGQMGSMSMNMKIQAIPNKKMKMTMTPNGQATGMMAMSASFMNNMTMVDDGKNLWVYMPAMKSYQKTGSQMGKNKVSDLAGYTKLAQMADLKLLRTQNLNGKPAQVIQAIPKMAMPQGGKQTILLYFDQATGRFKQMKMTGSGPAMPNQPPQTMNMSIVVVSETINGPIPDSAFTFTPPPGVKEMKGGMGMPGMGMPGMMGGGPPRRGR